MAKLHALILAKSQSKRLPNKNILDFHGKPMFLVNVEKCLKIFKEVYVSSDSKEILKMARKAGAIPIKRNRRLCGECPNIPVYQHAMSKMGETHGIVAVQANSPTIKQEIIIRVKLLIEERRQEVMTCHPDRTLYGSVWGLGRRRLQEYGNPYEPKPVVRIIDDSIDIHNQRDYKEALIQYENNSRNRT